MHTLVFISQPMNGRTNEEIEKERDLLISHAKARYGEEDTDIINSFFKNAPHDAAPLHFLGESIKLLGMADAVYFAPGWENARGCRVEHLCAEEYGIEIVEDYSVKAQ